MTEARAPIGRTGTAGRNARIAVEEGKWLVAIPTHSTLFRLGRESVWMALLVREPQRSICSATSSRAPLGPRGRDGLSAKISVERRVSD